MTTAEYILSHSAEKYTINTAGMQGFVNLAMLKLSSDFYGNSYNEAIALYAMHLYTKANNSDFNTSGVIKSEKVKNWSVNYSSGGGSDLLCSTYFGGLLAELNSGMIVPMARTSYTSNPEPYPMCNFEG